MGTLSTTEPIFSVWDADYTHHDTYSPLLVQWSSDPLRPNGRCFTAWSSNNSSTAGWRGRLWLCGSRTVIASNLTWLDSVNLVINLELRGDEMSFQGNALRRWRKIAFNHRWDLGNNTDLTEEHWQDFGYTPCLKYHPSTSRHKYDQEDNGRIRKPKKCFNTCNTWRINIRIIFFIQIHLHNHTIIYIYVKTIHLFIFRYIHNFLG